MLPVDTWGLFGGTLPTTPSQETKLTTCCLKIQTALGQKTLSSTAPAKSTFESVPIFVVSVH